MISSLGGSAGSASSDADADAASGSVASVVCSFASSRSSPSPGPAFPASSGGALRATTRAPRVAAAGAKPRRGGASSETGPWHARGDARGTRFGRTRVGDPRRASPRVGWRRDTTGRTRRTGAPGRARKPAPAAAAAAHALDIVPEGQPNEEGAPRGRFGPSRSRVSGTLRPEPPPRTPRTTRASPPRFARRGVDREPPLASCPRSPRPAQ